MIECNYRKSIRAAYVPKSLTSVFREVFRGVFENIRTVFENPVSSPLFHRRKSTTLSSSYNWSKHVTFSLCHIINFRSFSVKINFATRGKLFYCWYRVTKLSEEFQLSKFKDDFQFCHIVIKCSVCLKLFYQLLKMAVKKQA